MDVIRASLLVISISLLTAVLVPGDKKATPIEKLKPYRSWVLVTPQAIDMAPIIALSCVGPSKFNQEPNPHAPRLFKVYVNETGKAAMESKGKKPFPVGSMIVKEKFIGGEMAPETWSARKLTADSKPVLLTAMVKREKGFDPVNGDWEYVALSGDAGKKTTEGLKHCASCHQGRKKTDYVFGNYGSISHGRGDQ